MRIALVVAALCTGCVDSKGLLTALADDLALTAAAATQGFTTGVFDRWINP